MVASVSCIYGIGSPQDYAGLAPNVDKSVPLERDDLVHELIDIQYDRNDYDLQRGMFRVRGDTVDVFPPYAENPLRISFFGDEVEQISEVDVVTGEVVREFEAVPIWPASHYVTERPKVGKALQEALQDSFKEYQRQKAHRRKIAPCRRERPRLQAYELPYFQYQRKYHAVAGDYRTCSAK